MAYTSKQLTMAWTAVHAGIAPDEATQKSIDVFANFNAAGSVSDAAALAFVLNSADDTAAVALLTYQFFTGKAPTKEGLDYLVHSDANPGDLNDAYYAKFNLENRYINFAANLGVNGAGASDFAAKYGAMDFSDYVASIYETIVGASYAKAAGVDVDAALKYLIGAHDAVLATAKAAGMITDAMTPAQVDLALKAAMAGLVMAAAVKADVGIYAASANNFMLAMAQDKAVYGGDLVAGYGPTSGKGSTGIGKAVDTAPIELPGAPPKPPTPPVDTDPVTPAPPVTPTNFTFTLVTGNDRLSGPGIAGTFNATHATFNAGDLVDGRGAADTLNIVATTGATYAPPNATISNIEIAHLSSDAGVVANTLAWTGLTTLTVADRGATELTLTGATDLTLTNTAQGGAIMNVYGGRNVTVNSTGGGLITVGTSAFPPFRPYTTGDIVINRTSAGTDNGYLNLETQGSRVEINLTATNPTGVAQAGGYNTITSDGVSSVKFRGSAVRTDNGVRGAHTGDVLVVNNGVYNTVTTVDADGFREAYLNGCAITTLTASHGGGVFISNGTSTPSPATTLNATLSGINGRFVDSGVIQTLNLTQGAEISTLQMGLSGLKHLSIAAAGDITLTNLPTYVLDTITLTGAGHVDLGNLDTFTALTSLDASGSSSALTVTSSGADTVIHGGSGADVITLSGAAISKAVSTGGGDDKVVIGDAAAVISATLDGGAGTHDVLQLSAAVAEAASATPGRITGFETLDMGVVQGQTIDVSALGGATWIKAAGDGNLNGLASGSTVEIGGGANFGFGGASGSLTVLYNGPAWSGRTELGLLSSGGVGTMNIRMEQPGWDPSSYGYMEWHDASATTVNIAGVGRLAVAVGASDYMSRVDASGFDGDVLFYQWGTQRGPLTVLGSAHGDNTFHFRGLGVLTYTGGDGDDTISVTPSTHVIDVGSGDDTVIFSTGGSASNITSITGLGDHGDRLGVEFGSFVGPITQITGQTTLTAYLNAASASTTADFNSTAHWFEFGADVYVVMDFSNSPTFVGGFAEVVRLVGMAGHISGDLGVSTATIDYGASQLTTAFIDF